MIITSDFHTHTTFSHGTGSVEDNVRAAIDRNLSEIAIADHSVGHNAYGVRDIEAYLREIDNIKIKYKDTIKVKSGLELNLLSDSGELDLPKGYEDCFDILIFGYHKFVRYKGLSNAMHYLPPVSDSEKSIARNTKAYINALERYKIDIISHPGYGLPINKIEVAKTAAKRNTYMEINNKHPEFTADELKICAEIGVKFSVNSDAHSPEKVGIFTNSLAKIEEAGLPAELILNAKEQ